ncbi:MAG: hypothetical protein AAFX50_26395, partial [Acidobacteriota bacterium]
MSDHRDDRQVVPFPATRPTPSAEPDRSAELARPAESDRPAEAVGSIELVELTGQSGAGESTAPKAPTTEFEAAFDALAAAATDVELDGAEAADGMGEAAPRRAGTPKPWAVPPDSAGAGTVVPFRRPKKGSKIRRRRKSAWSRWLMPFAAACLIVGAPAAFVLWLLSAPSFAMTDLVVKTAQEGRVSSEWVRNALRRDAGSNL